MSAAPVSTAVGIESAHAANDLYEQYHDRIYAFCMSRTRNPADAEDATQTAFMHALNGLRRGVVPQFELTWLLRIAENVCHSMHRRAYRRYERDELPTDVISGQEDIALVTERFDGLCLALESLPDQQRRAILLREWRGLSYDDIADELGVSHAAVETTLFRARRSLVKQLGALAAFPFPAIGRLVQWIAGPAGAKAAAVAVVTIGTATAVASSTPAEATQTAARAEVASTSPTRTESRAATDRPAKRSVEVQRVRAPAAPTSTPVEPRLDAGAGDASTPKVPIKSPTESTTPEPTGSTTPEPAVGGVDLPTTPSLPAVPVVPTDVVAPLVEVAADVEDTLPIELPPLLPLPPLVPGLPLP
jgi:RNA polymerase sigma factor (sigma-70 family)